MIHKLVSSWGPKDFPLKQSCDEKLKNAYNQVRRVDRQLLQPGQSLSYPSFSLIKDRLSGYLGLPDTTELSRKLLQREILAGQNGEACSDLQLEEFAREFSRLAVWTGLNDAALNSLSWIGANYHRPVDLPDITGLSWRQGILWCLESVQPRSKTSPPAAGLSRLPSVAHSMPSPSAAPKSSPPPFAAHPNPPFTGKSSPPPFTAHSLKIYSQNISLKSAVRGKVKPTAILRSQAHCRSWF